MVRYFETNKQRLDFKVLSGKLVLSPTDQAEVDRYWVDVVKKNNPSATNDGVWTCRNLNERLLTVIQTDYSTARWGKNGHGILSMGTGLLVFEGNNVVFARRSQEVVADPGKISMAAGGVLDIYTPIQNHDFMGMVEKQIANELKEELVVRKKTEIVPIGVAVGDANKVEFCGAVFVNEPRIKGNEALELIKIPRRNLVEFTRDNLGNLELSTRWHLEYWAERIARTERLDFLK